tara:strand:+ start:386 stop:529 length:144 start_codon:yes stop_codon:yes gene_type:complete
MYEREFRITLYVRDEVEANTIKEAEEIPYTGELPEGALIDKPVVIKI